MTTRVAGQRGHAVVVGASIGGLLAARVLSDHFERVSVVERDELPALPANRRGVPQGRHVHLLTQRGSQIMERLFPGILGQLVDCGVAVWDDGDISKVYTALAGKYQLPASGYLRNWQPFYFPSRPLLEWAVRNRTQALANVSFLENHQLVSLMSTANRDRITGVCVLQRGCAGETSHSLTADLVVDATGRGSHLPIYLQELGYGSPRQQEVTVQLVYASQQVRLPPNHLARYAIAVPPRPERPTIWALNRQEAQWILTVGAMGGEMPPMGWHERVRMAAGHVPPDVLEALQDAQPVGEVAVHRLPSNRWRRYDEMKRFPSGLLVVGDALCSFNPIYGQGMTVAGLEALLLGECLRRGQLNDLASRFFDGAAKTVRVAWQLAVGADLMLPQVPGPRPRTMRITNAYMERVMAAAEVDLGVTEQFLRITGMLDSPARMLRPTFMLRVAMANRRRATPSRTVVQGR